MISLNSYSNLKIFHHADALNAISNGEHNAPLYIRLKPTNICNHHCAYCTYGSGGTTQRTENRDEIDHQDSIPWEKLQEILQDMGVMGVKALTFSGGGEPLCYPHIVEAAQLASDEGLELSLITNGQLLSEGRAEAFRTAKWVRISFDSPVQETYCRLRGLPESAFRTVTDNISTFAKEKDRDCVLGVNFVVSKANANEVYEAAHLLKELGVDNVKFAAVVENVPHYHQDIKDRVIEQIHRAQTDFADERFAVINNYENDWMDKNFTTQPFPVCYTCRLVTVIAADQRVYFCHTRAYDSKAIVGDLRDKGFREMWYSPLTIKRLTSLQPQNDCRNFCVYQERNQLIKAYFDVDMRHIDFI